MVERVKKIIKPKRKSKKVEKWKIRTQVILNNCMGKAIV